MGSEKIERGSVEPVVLRNGSADLEGLAAGRDELAEGMGETAEINLNGSGAYAVR